MPKYLLMLATCLALLFAGCGGGGEESTSGAGAQTTTQEAPADGAQSTPPSGGDTVVIDMKDIEFEPKDAEAKVGQTIQWVNQDTVEHNAVAEAGADFKSELFGKGMTFEATVDEAGKVEYVCTIHPSMTGTITVTE